MHAVSGLFHSHHWVLFAFPSRYCALSVMDSYLALEGGPPVFAPGFACPGLLMNRIRAPGGRKGLSPAKARLSRIVPAATRANAPAYPDLSRFGLLPLRSPLLRESRLISFPPGTGMFRFPGFAPSARRVPGASLGGYPIRDPGGLWLERLAPAFRRCPRPSSPFHA